MSKSSKQAQHDLLIELNSHYDMWTEDMERRLSRKNGWNEITDAYYGILPHDWPFISRTTDPRIRTALLEKNARLVNGKLRGRLAPREGGDTIKAEIHNALLDFQWDSNTEGGSMVVQLGIDDMDARLYGSRFRLVKWKTVKDQEGKVIYDGNTTEGIDIRDSGIDPTATHIRDAKWFQHRTWVHIDELDEESFSGVAEIKRKLKEKQSGNSSQRKNRYVSRLKQIRGMEDRTGEDIAFPVAEIVTEYRGDRWITFSPEFNLILRDIPNHYNHGKIPIAQLRYYSTQDDPIGESEVEPVLRLWLAIQMTVCGFLDEVVLKMRPPLKIIEGQARVETIEYGPEAQWIVNTPDAVTEMQSSGEAIRYFQITYSALVSAFNTAMGELSQGVGGVDPFNPEKTATEVRASIQQKNVRDQKNQNDLAEYIKDIMSMWVSNNKQFLLDDPKREQTVLRILGRDKYRKLKQAGFADDELSSEATQEIEGIIRENPDITDQELAVYIDAGMQPKFPVVSNPQEKDPEKRRIGKKLKISDTGDSAELTITAEDLEGVYDYIPDVKSMANGFTVELAEARNRAIEQFTTSPTYLQLLSQEGWVPRVKDLTIAQFEELGLRDAERYFEKAPDPQQQEGGVNGLQQQGQGIPPAAGNLQGLAQPVQAAGIPENPQANPQGGFQQQVAQTRGF